MGKVQSSNESSTAAEKCQGPRKEAKTNVSFMRKPRVPVHFARILLAPPHVVLRIMKKLWDKLVDTTVDKQRQELEIIRDAMQLQQLHA
jgi:hypothetical protein